MPAPSYPWCVRRLARAKINLRLEVLGLRPDGYHEVATFIHPISLADRILVAVRVTSADERAVGPAMRVQVMCPGYPMLAGPANLAYHAACRWLDAWSAIAPGRHALTGVSICIEKHIPVAAGLGGGSADAAAVLLALQQWDPLPPAELAHIAVALGSDVPYFVSGRPAVCRGRGEIVQPVASDMCLAILLGVPPFGVKAADAYRWWDADGGAAGHPAGVLSSLKNGSGLVQGLLARGGFVHNDLTAPVVTRHPLVGDLIGALLAQGALAAEMTGSGSAVFGVFDGATHCVTASARELANRYPAVLWQTATLAGGQCDPGEANQVPFREAGEG